MHIRLDLVVSSILRSIYQNTFPLPFPTLVSDLIGDLGNLRESSVVLFTEEGKSKNPGSSIKNVEDDRKTSLPQDNPQIYHLHLLRCRLKTSRQV